MDHDKRFLFYIDAYSPESIPMAKLAEYMADFATLLGVTMPCILPGSKKAAPRLRLGSSSW